MSFTMKNVRRNFKMRESDVAKILAMIRESEILTEKVQSALISYAKFRIYKFKSGRFTRKVYQEMIDELLEQVVKKPINQISYEDVKANEKQIIEEVIHAIYGRSIHSLFINRGVIDGSNFSGNTDLDIKSTLNVSHVERDELEDYFRSIMI